MKIEIELQEYELDSSSNKYIKLKSLINEKYVMIEIIQVDMNMSTFSVINISKLQKALSKLDL